MLHNFFNLAPLIAHQINKVLKMANVIYHKRFLLEKEIRSISDAEFSVIVEDEVLEAE